MPPLADDEFSATPQALFLTLRFVRNGEKQVVGFYREHAASEAFAV